VAVPAPRPWGTKGEGLDEVARRALSLAFVSEPQVLLDSGVGGAGVDEGQARVNRFGPLKHKACFLSRCMKELAPKKRTA
jgi:hypothetical protein